jgi:Amidase
VINGVAVPESCDAWCALAQSANVAGLPAASVPIGPGRSRLPVGLQIIGARWADATMLRAAAAVTACLADDGSRPRWRGCAARQPVLPADRQSPGHPLADIRTRDRTGRSVSNES